MGGITPEMLAALFPQGTKQAFQQGGSTWNQQPEQMSQQGQFNPADVQAQLSGGPAPPFSFAPGQGGVGSQILNALAQAGKAATYVAESPQERESEQNRAQQLWETKQKMGLAAQEFGQKEKDRAQQAATQREQFSQMEKDRAAQRDIAQQGRDVENRKTDETIRHDKAIEAMKDDPTDKKISDYVDEKNVKHVVMQKKDNSTYELTYGKVRQPPGGGEAKPVLAVNPAGKVITAKEGVQFQPGTQTLSQYGGQPQRTEKTLKPFRDIVQTYDDSVKLRSMAQAGNASADPDLAVAFFKMLRGAGGQGIRFTQQEQKLILGARNTMGDLEAFGQKVMGGGQKLTPDQRNSMIQVMKVHADAAQREIDRLEGTPGMGPQGGTAPAGKQGDPLGIL